MEGRAARLSCSVDRQSTKVRPPMQAARTVVTVPTGPQVVFGEPIAETVDVLATGRACTSRHPPQGTGMTRLRDRMSFDRDRPGAAVDPELQLELRRVANLFLVSSLTLVLFLLRAFALALHVTFIPAPVAAVWGLVLLTGWAATCVYAVYVTFKAGRWGWLVLCAIPFTGVPVAVAYAWVRRQEIETEVLGGGSRTRQRRGGRDARR
jgi:hypothetical protein